MRIPILLYHRVGPLDGSFMDAYTVSPAVFAEQLETIARDGWEPVPLEHVTKRGSTSTRRRPLIITFDDGFASNREHAWPVLEKHRYPSATFIVTGRHCNEWDGPSKANYPLLSREEIASANHDLFRFHSHSETHPPITTLSDAAARHELSSSRSALNEMVPLPGRMFAYPFGDWSSRSAKAVEAAGYSGGCTCYEGLNSTRTNPFILRRVEIHEEDLGSRFKFKLWTGRTPQWPLSRPPVTALAAEWLRALRTESR